MSSFYKYGLIVALIVSAILPLLTHAYAQPNVKAPKTPTAKTEALAPPQLIPVLPPVMTSYEVYIGGVHLLNAEILFQEQGGSYRTRVHAHTQGFWYRNVPWDTSLEAHGRIANDRFVPTEFANTNVWKNKPKSTKLTFDAQGDVTPQFDPPNTDQNREIVSADQSRGSYDPVSGLLQMLAQVAVNKNCDITVPIFDGKRRFDITGADEGSDQIDEEDYSAYKGNARVCNASFSMIAGDWKEKGHVGNSFWRLNDKDNGREPFHIWLASLAPSLPELPVRMQSGSLWGLIVVHLANWHYATAEEIATQTH